MLVELFRIGNFPVRSFGIMILLGFLACLWLLRRRSDKFGFDKAQVTDLAFYTLIAGILGARVLFLLQEWGYYSKHLNEVFTLQFEGLTSFGGILFGAAFVLYWAWRKKWSVGRLTDLVAPGFVVGHIFGRIGCLLNGCCYGVACDPKIAWGVNFPGTVGTHHPAQAYDALMNVAVLGGLLLFERRNFRPGQGAGLFLILHGLTRFIYEFWRAGSLQQVKAGEATSTYWGGLPITEAQAVALLMMFIGVVVFAIAARKARGAQAPEIQPA